MKMALYLVLAAVVAAAAWVRLAPSDPARWHVPARVAEDKTFKNGVVRVVEAGPDGLARLDAVAMAQPRTTRLAGSVDEGMVTWIARSRLFGFPDYITAQQTGDRLVIYARARFGRSDMGVNADRTRAWVALLQS